MGSAIAADIPSIPEPTTPPVFLTHPESQTVVIGNPVSLVGTSVGGNQIAYQWFKDGLLLPGKTGSTLTISYFSSSDAGSYTVQATNSIGSQMSRPGILTATATSLPPMITAQPGARRVTAGSYLSFSVVVSGSAPFTYQWFKNDVPLPGETGASYFILSVQASDVGSYSVRISNIAGTVTSVSALLTLLGPPSVTMPPSPISVSAGSTATFSATVDLNGATDLFYYWVKDGRPLSDRITSSSPNVTLTLPNVQTIDEGNYALNLFTSGGAVQSTSARLTVLRAPTFIIQPEDATVNAGETVSFSTTVEGNPTPSFQWFRDNAPVAGATFPQLTLSQVQTAHAGNYTLVATNAQGSATSRLARLTVQGPTAYTPVSILQQPVSQTASQGSTVTFSVTATGYPAPTFAWYKGSTLLSGETSNTLTLSRIGTNDDATYFVSITNPIGGVLSAGAKLTVTAASPPVIVVAPASQTAKIGDRVTFTCTATGALSYRWYKDGVPIPGVAASSLTLVSVQPSDFGRYTVVASNATGTATCPPAILTLATSNAAGIYFGNFASNAVDRFALVVREDNSALFLGYSSPQSAGYAAKTFKVEADGSFHAELTVLPSSIRQASTDGTLASKANFQPSTSVNFNGSLLNGVLAGAITQGALKVDAVRRPSGGPAQTFAGVYEMEALNSGTERITLIVDATGQASLFSINPNGFFTGAGTLDPASGQISIILQDGTRMLAVLSPETGKATATLIQSSSASQVVFAGMLDSLPRNDHLANISSRAAVSSNPMVAGFVIRGTASKRVLIRATGPALAAYGISDFLPDPKLELYRGAEKILENDDWSTGTAAADVIAAARQTGAFALPERSRDAVLLTTLPPGSYTAIISASDGVSGVGLVEVYDADSSEQSSTVRLINISTRAVATRGNGVLIAGIVVKGNAPKKLLIRAAGPALAAFKVNDVLADPILQLYQDESLILQNDNWAGNEGEREQIEIAEAATGAFAFLPGSKDAAILTTLAPGSYTTQVRGVADSVGAVMVEVYEVPR